MQRQQVNNKLILRGCSILHVRMLYIFCYIVFLSKSREIFNRWPNNTGRFNRVETCIIYPIHLHKRVCLYFQSVKPQLRKVRACSIKTLHSHGIQESTHLVFFTWSLLHLISDWFSDTLFTSINALTILDFLIEAAAALFWLLRSISGSSGGSNREGLISLTGSWTLS